ncbi:hypothetical protein B296_00036298 [Ensete ventricosum]|uniref:Uncharacterized protein n=1 Tax=Ensete ventricosum TaxID=4639 RepID=A0A427A2X8_ENSVE|nr:hypothetical protein B296_00036298 [Ensete ventricosum]
MWVVVGEAGGLVKFGIDDAGGGGCGSISITLKKKKKKKKTKTQAKAADMPRRHKLIYCRQQLKDRTK